MMEMDNFYIKVKAQPAKSEEDHRYEIALVNYYPEDSSVISKRTKCVIIGKRDAKLDVEEAGSKIIVLKRAIKFSILELIDKEIDIMLGEI